MSAFDNMRHNLPFDGMDPELEAIRAKAWQLLRSLNQTYPLAERQRLCSQLFASFGYSMLQSPFHCEFGKTIHIGEKVFINMNVVMLDNADIYIEDEVFIGPSCQFYTASHSLDYKARQRWETIAKPIRVKKNAWIGGNSVINQGVTIGERAVIGAGSVVNSDVPDDCVFAGAPARFIKRVYD